MCPHAFIVKKKLKNKTVASISSRGDASSQDSAVCPQACLHMAGVCVCVKSLSRVRLFVTPWTAAYQVPPSTGFSQQEYWSGVQFPSPGDLPDPGIEPQSPAL